MPPGDPQDEIATAAGPPTVIQTPLKPGGGGGGRFGPGIILGGRFRVTRFITQGGMGEVYEAWDTQLGRNVALKTILPRYAMNPIAVERFKREIAIATSITHPNVCRVHDLYTHPGPPDTYFLAMEYLDGMNLRQAIEKGQFTEQTALPVAEDIAVGLATAHAAGIIHRDFKSANVMLVPGPGGVRAVVMDFGLARLAEGDEGTSALTASEYVVGTYDYMAPEQVEGLHLTAAADVYAFGIVLYEMLTRTLPFRGGTAISRANKRLHEAPTPPRIYMPGLDPHWEQVILRCLARNPHERFGSVTDVAQALRTGVMPPPLSGDTRAKATVAMPPARAPARTRSVVGLTAILLVALAVGVWRMWPPRERDLDAPIVEKIPIRRAVAVLSAQNHAADADTAWLSTAIPEILAATFAAGGALRVIPRDEVAAMESDLAVGGKIEPALLQRVRRRLGADVLVASSCSIVGERGSGLLRIEARALDPKTGSVLATSSASGTESQLFDVVSRAAAGLRKTLGLSDLSPAQSLEAEATIPAKLDAMRFYSEGLARLRALDAKGAREWLERAVAADDEHPLVHAALAETWTILGQGTDAEASARRALALANRLPWELKMRIAARAHRAAREWDAVIEAEKALWNAHRDMLTYGIDLANTQITAGRAKEALVTVSELRQLPPPLSADGRIDLVEARASQELADLGTQQARAAAAAAKARASGERMLLAKARMLESTALLQMGNRRGSIAAADEARAAFGAAGDRGGVARALEQTAATVGSGGDLDGERRMLEQALAIHRQRDDRNSVARVLVNIGDVCVRAGRSTDAQAFFDEGLAAFRAAGETYEAAVTLNNIGALLFHSGDLIAAHQRYKEALTLYEELGDKSGTALTLTNIAEVLACRGDLDGAQELHQESLAINRTVGDRSAEAYDLIRIGDIYALRGDRLAARIRYEEALRIQNEAGEHLDAADTRAALAALLLDEGRAAEAEKTAREAEEIHRTGGAGDRSVPALVVLTHALLAQGRTREAVEIAERAWTIAAKGQDRRHRFAAAMAKARVQSDVDAALRFLESLRAEAAKTLFVASELEIRLSIAQIEVAAGRAAGRRRLQQLEKEAKAKGFGEIARRAGRVI